MIRKVLWEKNGTTLFRIKFIQIYKCLTFLTKSLMALAVVDFLLVCFCFCFIRNVFLSGISEKE